MATAFEVPLLGPQGEPVDLVRTIMSHGVADLPPGRVDEEAGAYETTLALRSGRPARSGSRPEGRRSRESRFAARGSALVRRASSSRSSAASSTWTRTSLASTPSPPRTPSSRGPRSMPKAIQWLAAMRAPVAALVDAVARPGGFIWP